MTQYLYFDPADIERVSLDVLVERPSNSRLIDALGWTAICLDTSIRELLNREFVEASSWLADADLWLRLAAEQAGCV